MTRPTAVSERGFIELASHEAIVTSPYYDSKGVITIGVGHTAAAGAPDPETMPAGEAIAVETLLDLFRADLNRYTADVLKVVKVPLTQHELDALVSFHFNTGAIGRAELVKKLNAGDRAGAAKGFMNWVKPAEIKGRREKEQALFRDGVYENDGKVTVYPADAKGRVLWSKGKRVTLASLQKAQTSPAPKPKPATKPAPAPEPIKPYVAWENFDKPAVERVQKILIRLGYFEVGEPDGKPGDRTRGALSSFQIDNGLPSTGEPDDATMLALIHGKPRPVADARKEASAAKVEAAAPGTVAPAEANKGIAAVTGGTGAAGMIAYVTSKVLPEIQPVVDFFADVPSWVWMALVIVLAAAFWFNSRRVAQSVTEAYRVGKLN